MSIFNDWIEQFSKLFQNFSQNIQDILASPMSIITLLGCILLLIVFAKAKKIKFTPELIARIGIALALATILKMLRLYHFPQGGSITLGSMIPVLLIAFIYGPEVGCLTGFLYGVITLILDPYILHPIQVLFDYPLPFTALGLAGFFKQRRLVGVSIAILVRFLCHLISGIVFFGSFAPEGMSPVVYSLLVNGPMIGIEGIICLVILAVLPIERIFHASSVNTISN
ncbi:energy-coupled thiamine transporter ThiT [Clostridium beijerinckii]|jgi:probable proton-coupled thiamine transporter YuaJ|uniref:Energy-coupled thiamine transporter ThiT n=2 Tax=Clostridium beijerinckii TaxID=1520 RepID=A0AAE2RR60_CLOBE|nr:energy-coupled thiamine transporter ThiT [Clostridium beijerinckii]ABR32256.1 putative proton-coupled thiamine transporter YuaJ [Clostridium beijerinckii NCIMB 8052]AIU04596.1 putative proton-coupled thiamine transporter YuaJ [Clostridium beijerinckii ATCC 35702]MBF7808068.1 energy-coupled thiamine transporter ThiT [Clostridium beijerinckii]NRT21631.1 thiamine transporter [Clostridium beijerinckii]NRT65867.1 thiamine transporter [Clostridium beijerinckii]